MIERITRKWLEDRDACYSEDEIAKLIPEGGLTLEEALQLEVPNDDKIWAAIHLLPLKELTEFATQCAWRAARYAVDRASNPYQYNLSLSAAQGAAQDASTVERRVYKGLSDEACGYAYSASFHATAAAYNDLDLGVPEQEKQLEWITTRLKGAS